MPAPRTSGLSSRRNSPLFGAVQQSRFSPYVGPSVNASRIARTLRQSLHSGLRPACRSGIRSRIAFPTNIRETPPRPRERFCASFLWATHALQLPFTNAPPWSVEVKRFTVVLAQALMRAQLRLSAWPESTRMDRCNGTTILLNTEVLKALQRLHTTCQPNRKNRNQRSKSSYPTNQRTRSHCLPVLFSKKRTITTQDQHLGISMAWTAYRRPQLQVRW